MRPKRRRPTYAHLVAIASATGFALLSFASGCAGRATSVCQKACDCELLGEGGCLDSELEACVEDIEEQIARADAADCGSYFDDYIACVEAQLDSCRSGTQCRGESALLSRCLGEAPSDGEE